MDPLLEYPPAWLIAIAIILAAAAIYDIWKEWTR